MADDAYTLADFQSRAQTTREAAVIRTWRERMLLADRLRWQKVNSLEIEMIRTKTMPTSAWLDIGESLPSMKGTTEPVKERVHKIGGCIDVPKEYTLAKSLVNERASQEQMATESMAYSFNDALINGDPTVDRKEIVGLRYRLSNLLESEQTVEAEGLDITMSTAETNWDDKILDYLEALRDACDGHDCDAFILDITTKSRIEAALRQSGLLATTKDQVGVRHMTYGDGGPEFMIAGYQSGNRDADKVIGHTEDEDGSELTGGVCTSIYAVKFGKPYLFGFYLQDISVVDVGLLENGTHYRTNVDWDPGIAHVHPASFARLVGVQAAEAAGS